MSGSREKLNKIIRQNYAGGSEILDLLCLVSCMRQRCRPGSEEHERLTVIEDKLQAVRGAIVADIRGENQ